MQMNMLQCLICSRIARQFNTEGLPKPLGHVLPVALAAMDGQLAYEFLGFGVMDCHFPFNS
jgi:hypothetical protein